MSQGRSFALAPTEASTSESTLAYYSIWNFFYRSPRQWWDRFIFGSGAFRLEKRKSCSISSKRETNAAGSVGLTARSFPFNRRVKPAYRFMMSRSQCPISGEFWSESLTRVDDESESINVTTHRVSTAPNVLTEAQVSFNSALNIGCAEHLSQLSSLSDVVKDVEKDEESSQGGHQNNDDFLRVNPTGACSKDAMACLARYVVEEQLVELLIERSHRSMQSILNYRCFLTTMQLKKYKTLGQLSLQRSWFFPQLHHDSNSHSESLLPVPKGVIIVVLIELLCISACQQNKTFCSCFPWAADPSYRIGKQTTLVRLMRELLRFASARFSCSMQEHHGSRQKYSKVLQFLRDAVINESKLVHKLVSLSKPTAPISVPTAARVLLEVVYMLLQCIPFVKRKQSQRFPVLQYKSIPFYEPLSSTASTPSSDASSGNSAHTPLAITSPLEALTVFVVSRSALYTLHFVRMLLPQQMCEIFFQWIITLFSNKSCFTSACVKSGVDTAYRCSVVEQRMSATPCRHPAQEFSFVPSADFTYSHSSCLLASTTVEALYQSMYNLRKSLCEMLEEQQAVVLHAFFD